MKESIGEDLDKQEKVEKMMKPRNILSSPHVREKYHCLSIHSLLF
jgi:hypothetical protein